MHLLSCWWSISDFFDEAIDASLFNAIHLTVVGPLFKPDQPCHDSQFGLAKVKKCCPNGIGDNLMELTSNVSILIQWLRPADANRRW